MERALILKQILLLVTFLVTGCSQVKEKFEKAKIEPTPAVQDSAFRPYIDRFELETNINVNITVSFRSNLGGRRAGICRKHATGEREVLIDQTIWLDNLTEDQKDLLLWHELGHCIVNLKHDLRRDINTLCPLSLMDKSVPSTYCVKKLTKRHYFDFFLNKL